MTDVIVVGSGAGAVHAAWPLVEAGMRVRMLDWGNLDSVYEPLVPDGAFAEIRRRDPEQHRFFLGEDFEGVAFGGVRLGAQLTPPRQFVSRDTERLTPVSTETFFPMESLAIGGLAGAWGAGCPPFAAEDFDGYPISLAEIEPSYEAVAARIGVGGARDDLLPAFGDLRSMLPPVDVDSNAKAILARYGERRESLLRAGFRLGRPRLAMLSVPHRGRSPTRYRDMDFWSDRGRSVYRPRWTVEELRGFPNFEYQSGALVESFEERAGGGVVVRARDRASGETVRHDARALVLAAGTLGTARIVLRSLGLYDRRVPIVTNPHTYAPMIHLGMLGRTAEDARHSLAQLCFAYRPPGESGSTVGHLYSYRSLLDFRLVKEIPLPYREALRVVRHLLTSFTILLIQHADRPTDAKWCALRRGGEGAPDTLETHYALAPEEERRIDRTERAICALFRRIRCICLRRVRPGHAASVHYAGTFPMTAEERPLTTTPDGRLRGTRSVWLADGSVFPHLPSRGLTFTMMANADRIGSGLRDSLRS